MSLIGNSLSNPRGLVPIEGTPFEYDRGLNGQIEELNSRVRDMRKVGKLAPEELGRIRQYFRIKNIYHSNAIEGNQLDIGETRQVVEAGLTIAGKPLKDQAEAKNLGHALDFLEQLAKSESEPISLQDVRQVHKLILQGIDDSNAGVFRKVDVAISGSDFSPPNPLDVDPQMRDLIDWLGPLSFQPNEETLPTAAACHAWFAQIHPFIDGNGRTARILMNLVLMRAGYPIAVITREDRTRYYDALEQSQASDLTPFIALMIECVSETLEEYETAAENRREQIEWAQSLASQFTQPELTRTKNEYELWRSAMDLLVNHYKQIVHQLNDSAQLGDIYIRDFGMLAFEKYLALRQRQSAKKTWFFIVDFYSGGKTAKYLHFFGFANSPLSKHTQVSLHLVREEGASNFERLDHITAPNVPSLREIGYSSKDELFIARYGPNSCKKLKIEEIARNFFEDVVKCHFQQ
jgi:Fic family protein